MKICGIVALLLLASGCATTRVVNLDTGHGPPIVYQPSETEPIGIDEAEFKRAVAQLVLDLDLNVRHAFEQDNRLSLLASAGGVVDGAQGRTPALSYTRPNQQPSDPEARVALLTGGLRLEPMELRMMALTFALDTIWEGVADAAKDFTNPAALRAMVVSVVGTALVMLVAPEPITKLVAIALTASLIAYLGTGPVWNLGQGFLQLMEESKNARTLSELRDVGHRFGKALGDNGARVLVIVALSVLGGKNAQMSRLPGAARAELRAQAEGGFQLSAAWAGGVQSMAIHSAGVLNVVLAPTAVAAVAMGSGNAMQGDPEGDIHHICTNKNEVSEASGGPWTPLFQEVFDRARMSLDDAANKMRIKGHKGPHPAEYHQAVLRRIDQATQRCRGPAECRAALMEELAKIAQDLSTEGTKLRRLITKSP